MKHLPVFGRLLPVLALVAVTVGLGAASADASRTTRACVHPRFVTSDTNGGQTFGRYYVHNNMWNVAGYKVKETLRRAEARVEDELYEVLGEALRRVTPEDILGWFQHAGLCATHG